MLSAMRPISVRPNDFPRVFGISRSQACKMIAEGIVPVRKMGRATIVLVEDVEAYLRSRPTGVGEAPTAAIEARKAKREGL